ncbi:MAG: DUF3868 domain-containing protein [Rikenellaceae bacterium]
MKRTLCLTLGVLISTFVTAQTIRLDVAHHECKIENDSLIVQMALAGDINNLNSRDAVVLTPHLDSSDMSVDLQHIQFNGRHKQILHDRNKDMRNRMKSESVISDRYTQALNSNGKFRVDYRASVALTDWMCGATLRIRCDVLNEDGEANEISETLIQQVDVSKPVTTTFKPVSNEDVVETLPTPKYTIDQSETYRGSYVAPDSDATDERNQKDLNFSLEEAQVMVNVNPQILSLKELFTVAMSYNGDREKFYHIISTCVKLYPTHPIANLNAASMAIELGDKEAANKYLQIAPYESLAYRNCRGAYELMNGNIYEGIRLLKSAKSDGSEEAGYNLDLFFKLNK